MKAAIAGLLGVILLGCPHPVQVGLRGVEADVDTLAAAIEAGMPLIEEATVLIGEATVKLDKAYLPRIEELRGRIAEVVVLEEELGKVSDSLAILAESPRATEPHKEQISTLMEKVGGLTGSITILKEADRRLEEVKVRIEEGRSPGEEKAAPPRRVIERRVR